LDMDSGRDKVLPDSWKKCASYLPDAGGGS
jgi:hypothetical protein